MYTAISNPEQRKTVQKYIIYHMKNLEYNNDSFVVSIVNAFKFGCNWGYLEKLPKIRLIITSYS